MADDPRYRAEEDAFHKREQKIRKFFKELTQWASTSVILVGINLFVSGGFTWAKWPVVIWGIVVAAHSIEVLRHYKLNRDWERRRLQDIHRASTTLPEKADAVDTPDYSEDLLDARPERERLSEYRELQKPWREDDLV